MSKNYQNTIIYKIVCKDVSINDIYVGHTTDFIKRKCGHKSMCNNNKKNLKIYKTIRENGGWENWEMVEIEKYPCNNGGEARARERYWIVGLNCSMNSNMKSASLSSYDNGKYHCEKCGVTTNNKYDYNKHTMTSKHINTINGCKMSEACEKYCKKCDKSFKSPSGLWKHNKKCVITKHENDEECQSDSDICKYLQNSKEETKEYINLIKQLQEIIIQQNKTIIEQNRTILEFSKTTL